MYYIIILKLIKTMSKQIISSIFPEVFKALIEGLQGKVKVKNIII